MTRPRLRSALPEVFQTAAAGSPALQAVLSVADAMLGPVADTLDGIEVVADPYRAPEHVAVALAWWVDLGWLTAPDTAAAYRRGDAVGAAHGIDRASSSADLDALGAKQPGPLRAGRADTEPRLRATVPRGTTGLRDLIAAAPELTAQRGTAAGMIRFLELATGATGWQLTVDPDQCHLVVQVPAPAAGAHPAVRTIVETIKPAHITATIQVASHMTEQGSTAAGHPAPDLAPAPPNPPPAAPSSPPPAAPSSPPPAPPPDAAPSVRPELPPTEVLPIVAAHQPDHPDPSEPRSHP